MFRSDRDPRCRPLADLLVVLTAAAIVLAGCGGGSHHVSGEREGGGEAEQAQSAALDKIPDADRTAFIQLATAIGTLRARAAPVAVGTADQLVPAAPILSARSQVAALDPSDPGLAATRNRLLPALTRFSHAPLMGPAARRAARAAIAAADRIEAGLRRYSRTQPAIGGVIPD